MVGILAPAMVRVQGVKEQPFPGIDTQNSMDSTIPDAQSLVQSFPPPTFVVNEFSNIPSS